MSNINEYENGNTIGKGGFAPENNDSTPSNDNKEVSETAAANESVSVSATEEKKECSTIENEGNMSSDSTSDKVGYSTGMEVNTNAPASTDMPIQDIPGQTTVSSGRETSSDIPQNPNYGGLSNGMVNRENSAYRPEHYAESAGIRYNADKNSGDGNYTWQYCNADKNPMYIPPKKKHKVLKTVLISIGCVVVAGAIGALGWFLAKNMNMDQTPSYMDDYEEVFDRPDDNVKDDITDKHSDIPVIGRKDNDDDDSKASSTIVTPDENGILTKQMIAIKCKPSSVGIEVAMTTQSYFGAYKTSGVGSGFILTEDGYIATNNHVVQGADEVTVMLDDGTKYPAKIIGTDSVTDLAVLKIEATGLIPMEIGDSDLMQVGDSVIAIGTPAGIEFAGTVTDGIVSAINRAVEVPAGNGYTKRMTLMQTNAAINPGNSGGPLINNKGEVVGINTLKLTEAYEGIGFSIPINSAVSIINQLISEGHVTNYDQSFVTGNGSIGISAVDVTEEESKFYGIPVGVLVMQVKPGSSAAAAGLRRGDIITAFNGTKTASVAELNELKADFKAGDEVTLTVYRDPNEYTDITFKLDVMG